MNKIYIYKHTFPNGKVYIGQTNKKPEYRWDNGNGYKGSPLLFKAINKYGWDNIRHEILFSNLDQLNADIIEEDLIFYYKSINLTYNLANGGKVNRGRHHSEESKKKQSEALKGKKGKKVIQIDPNTLQVVKVWNSMKDIENTLGIKHQCISAACSGKIKTSGGFIWRLKDDVQ